MLNLIHKNEQKQKKLVTKDGKVLYKLMNIAVYGKTMENRINVTLIRNEKDYLKGTSKPSYMSQKVFDYNLVAIC